MTVTIDTTELIGDQPLLTSAERAIAAIRRGEIVVVVDDEDRENEGDLVMAADHVTAQAGTHRTRSRAHAHLPPLLPNTRRTRTLHVRYTATRHIGHPAPTLLTILSDVRTLATWNPALGPLHPADSEAVVGRPYRTLLRGLLPAVVTFTRIDETTVEYRMRAGGAEERGSWTIETIDAGGSRGTHAFTHSGTLLKTLRHAFAPVAAWRLNRLEHEAEALRT